MSISLEYDSSDDPLARDQRLIVWAFTIGAALLAISPTLFALNFVQRWWAGLPAPMYGAGLPYTVFVPLWAPVLLWCAIGGAGCLARRRGIASIQLAGAIAFAMACAGAVLLNGGFFREGEEGAAWAERSAADLWGSAFEVIGTPAPSACLLLPFICRQPLVVATWRRRALTLALVAFVLTWIGSLSNMMHYGLPEWLGGGSLWNGLLKVWRQMTVRRKVFCVAAWLTACFLLISLVRRQRAWAWLAAAAGVTYAVAYCPWTTAGWIFVTDGSLSARARQLDTYVSVYKRATCMLLTLLPAVWLSIRWRDSSSDTSGPDAAEPVSSPA